MVGRKPSLRGATLFANYAAETILRLLRLRKYLPVDSASSANELDLACILGTAHTRTALTQDGKTRKAGVLLRLLLDTNRLRIQML